MVQIVEALTFSVVGATPVICEDEYDRFGRDLRAHQRHIGVTREHRRASRLRRKRGWYRCRGKPKTERRKQAVLVSS